MFSVSFGLKIMGGAFLATAPICFLQVVCLSVPCQLMKTERLIHRRQFRVIGISVFAKDMCCHDFLVAAQAEREVDHPLSHLRGQSPALHGHPSCPYEGTLGCCSPETVGPVRLVRRENHDDPSCVLPRSRVCHQPFPCSFDHFDFRNRNRG